MKLLTILMVLAYSTVTYSAVSDVTLCDTGIEITQTVVVEDKGNALIIHSGEQVFVVAFDYNRDGIYETLLFDTDGNGYMDMQLEGGQATADEVQWLFCQYQRFSMS